jgi:Holliday junction resolvase RusA-like endonuclease
MTQKGLQDGHQECFFSLNFGADDLPTFENIKKISIKVVILVNNVAKDIDNLLKFVLDILKSVIYANDRVVWAVVPEKWHGVKSDQKTTIEIEELVGF